MQYHFELYVLTDTLTPAIWIRFYQAVQQYNGILGKFELTVRCADNIVRIFVKSDKDLSGLSNNMDGMLLQPVNENEMKPPEVSAKERLVQFVSGGNLLDLKEKYSVKKVKELEFAVFKMRSVSPQQSFG